MFFSRFLNIQGWVAVSGKRVLGILHTMAANVQWVEAYGFAWQ